MPWWAWIVAVFLGVALTPVGWISLIAVRSYLKSK